MITWLSNSTCEKNFGWPDWLWYKHELVVCSNCQKNKCIFELHQQKYNVEIIGNDSSAVCYDRPHLKYCVQFWSPQHKNAKKLENMQRRTLRGLDAKSYKSSMFSLKKAKDSHDIYLPILEEASCGRRCGFIFHRAQEQDCEPASGSITKRYQNQKQGGIFWQKMIWHWSILPLEFFGQMLDSHFSGRRARIPLKGLSTIKLNLFLWMH